jgi:hypothetical protein
MNEKLETAKNHQEQCRKRFEKVSERTLEARTKCESDYSQAVEDSIVASTKYCEIRNEVIFEFEKSKTKSKKFIRERFLKWFEISEEDEEFVSSVVPEFSKSLDDQVWASQLWLANRDSRVIEALAEVRRTSEAIQKYNKRKNPAWSEFNDAKRELERAEAQVKELDAQAGFPAKFDLDKIDEISAKIRSMYDDFFSAREFLDEVGGILDEVKE